MVYQALHLFVYFQLSKKGLYMYKAPLSTTFVSCFCELLFFVFCVYPGYIWKLYILDMPVIRQVKKGLSKKRRVITPYGNIGRLKN